MFQIPRSSLPWSLLAMADLWVFGCWRCLSSDFNLKLLDVLPMGMEPTMFLCVPERASVCVSECRGCVPCSTYEEGIQAVTYGNDEAGQGGTGIFMAFSVPFLWWNSLKMDGSQSDTRAQPGPFPTSTATATVSAVATALTSTFFTSNPVSFSSLWMKRDGKEIQGLL